MLHAGDGNREVTVPLRYEEAVFRIAGYPGAPWFSFTLFRTNDIPTRLEVLLNQDVYQSQTIAVAGSRLAFVGIGTTTNGQFVWTSADDGHTWNRELLPGVPGDRVQITTGGETVTMIASTTAPSPASGSNHTEVWTARWLDN